MDNKIHVSSSSFSEFHLFDRSNPTFIQRLKFIDKSRRGSSVAWSGRSARKRRSGDRPGTIPLRTCAALSSSFCHFTNPTGVGNLAGGAETKPPREKSSISAISQIQKDAKKSSIRVTSEVRKCPKTHFCRFSFSRNSHFCDLRKN